jgi:heterodisulfide reductase subunit C
MLVIAIIYIKPPSFKEVFMATVAPARAKSFSDAVVAGTYGSDPHLDMCIQCGTCGGSCPSGPDMDHTPRLLFAMIDAGMKEEVLKSNTPWYCVSCYYCMVRCPQDVHITDIMYTLKRMAIKEGFYRESSGSDASDFSETFIDFVENYGRSFELGVAAVHHLRHQPMNALRMATGMGFKMLTRGRMDLTPTRIKNLGQLQKILAKAKEIGGEG